MADLYNYLDRTEGQERAYHPDKSALLAPSADEVPTMLSVGFASSFSLLSPPPHRCWRAVLPLPHARSDGACAL